MARATVVGVLCVVALFGVSVASSSSFDVYVSRMSDLTGQYAQVLQDVTTGQIGWRTGAALLNQLALQAEAVFYQAAQACSTELDARKLLVVASVPIIIHLGAQGLAELDSDKMDASTQVSRLAAWLGERLVR